MARKKTSPAAPGGTELGLEGDLTIYTAAAQREAILAWLTGGTGEAIIDLSRVLDCDSAGVQLLLATRASLAQEDRPLQLRASSAPVHEALGAFGLGDDLVPRKQAVEGASA